MAGSLWCVEDSVKSLQKMEVRDGEMQGLVVEGKGPRLLRWQEEPEDTRVASYPMTGEERE